MNRHLLKGFCLFSYFRFFFLFCFPRRSISDSPSSIENKTDPRASKFQRSLRLEQRQRERIEFIRSNQIKTDESVSMAPKILDLVFP